MGKGHRCRISSVKGIYWKGLKDYPKTSKTP